MAERTNVGRRLRHPLVRFFGILIGAYLVWFLVYELWLGPDGRLDEWVSLGVAAVSTGLLDVFGAEPMRDGRHIWLAGIPGVLVDDSCNGITSLGLFVAFVLAFPGSWGARMWFIPLGILIVYSVNVARIAGLVIIQLRAPESFDVAHELGMTFIFYAAIFGLWVLWTHLGDGAQLRAGARPVLTT